jgi:sodium-dependent phosphate cotransporter
MTHLTEASTQNSQVKWQDHQGLKWIAIFLLTYLLIVAVDLIGLGLQSVTGDRVQELFALATNPFLGLIVGTLTTALVQSSSTVTSIVVGLVSGGLPVVTAIPIVMGANIGTSITNTLVSLGHMGDHEEFRRAFAAATIHDFFNILSVVIFLPLEILLHPMEKTAHILAQSFVSAGSMEVNSLNFVAEITKPVVVLLTAMIQGLSSPFEGIMLTMIGIFLIFSAIICLGKLLKSLLAGHAQGILHAAMGKGAIAGITMGTLMTVLVQSSSTTTSFMVPLAASNVFQLEQIYPFTLGANIGTCITALLAATSVSGELAIPALEIALVHLLYNIFGVMVIYGIPVCRRLPILSAQALANVACDRKEVAFVYIMSVFFLVPGLLLGASVLVMQIWQSSITFV